MNQDMTVIVEFIVTDVSLYDWENNELTFSNSDYFFYDADVIADHGDTIDLSIKAQFTVMGSNVDEIVDSFAEYGNTRETDILFDGIPARIKQDKLYSVFPEPF